MKTFKGVYNFRKPFWTAYGRVVFVEAVNAQDAAYQIWRVMREREPEAEFFDVDIQPSTSDAARQYREYEARRDAWRSNVYTNQPNQKAHFVTRRVAASPQE